MNRFANTSRYIYAILSGIPIGLILLVFGIRGISLDEGNLYKRTGVVKELKEKEGLVFLKLNNEYEYYHTGIPERVEIINENIQIGDKVTVYRIKNNEGLYFIEKLVKNNAVLIEFNKAPLVPFISLLLGSLIIIAGIIYLAQNFSDLFGGNKEKMEDFIDPWRKNKT
jgi:hypothetical protein